MRILFLSRLYWPHRGGVEKHVEKISEQLIKAGHEITVITEQYDPELPLEETYHQVKIIRIPYFALKSKLSLWTWMENHIDLVDAADLVHIHDVFWWYLPTWVLRLFTPAYITFHGYEGSQPPTKKAVLWRKLAEFACRGSICVGGFMRKWYWARPTEVIYGAADNKPGNKIETKNAAFIGRFDYDTGVDIYLSAAKQLRELKQIDFYGDGPLTKELVKQLKTDQHIKIKKWTDRADQVLRTHRFAWVSRYLGIIEAMQSKRLVVAVYNNQIKKDYLICHPMRDNMLIVGNADELVFRMREIIKQPERENFMIERAYNWAKKQRWETITQEYMNLWQR